MSLSSRITLICVLVILTHSLISRAVVNGEERYFPQVVSVETFPGSCTATWIAPRLLLTAAHCGSDRQRVRVLSSIKFYLQGWGETTFLDGTLHLHPDYTNNKSEFDLAVIEVDGPSEDSFSPWQVTKGSSVSEGIELSFIGWGQNDFVPKFSGSLVSRIGKVRTTGVNEKFIHSKTVIRKGPLKFIGIGSRETFSGAANGDSGGPLFVEREGKQTIVGITSSIDRRNGKVIETRFVNLASPSSQHFIQEMLQKYR